MATVANLTAGATPTHTSHADPFVNTPSPYTQQLRYATLDHEQFSSYSSSPAQARRAIEAHLKETHRRMQDAAKLGATLVKQRDTLSERLKELETVRLDDEVPGTLRQKLADIEKEYNEVGRESARAFLPKLKPSNSDATTLTGQGGSSPSKVSAPSRRQRNQPGARVHDIEFAAEISTSLLAQCRHLQATLAERDASIKDNAASRAQLESDVANLTARVKQMDERSQGFKDENWNLETRIQELESTLKSHSEDHARLNQTLGLTQADKSAAQRSLDDLRLAHEKALETHASDKKQQDQDLHALRRDLANHQAEKQLLQKQVDELNSNNKELARAVSYRLNAPTDTADASELIDDSDEHRDLSMTDNLDMSPVKGTPARPGMLESETIKSSLNHAHRMIQNLKNNIHREKAEKLELKRMLNDARDELERQGSNTRATSQKAGRKIAEREARGRRGLRLGANGQPIITTEVLDDPEWEDNEDATPSKTRPVASRTSTRDGETTDAFETADERRETTETEGFETGHEAFDEDDSDALTETEGGLNRSVTIRKRASQQPASSVPGDRQSFLSTASTSSSDDEGPSVRTPSHSLGPKYRLKKGNRRSGRYSQIFHGDSASNHSTPQNVTQTLGDELDGLDDASVEGTPSKMRDALSVGATPESAHTTPARADDEDVDQTVLVTRSPLATVKQQPTMVDAGVMTERWEPEHVAAVIPAPAEPTTSKPEADQLTPKRSFSQRMAGVAGGALAGFGLGRIKDSKAAETGSKPGMEDDSVSPADVPSDTAVRNVEEPLLKQQLSFSEISHEAYEPMQPVLERQNDRPSTAIAAAIQESGAAEGTENMGPPQELSQTNTVQPPRKVLGELSPNVSARELNNKDAIGSSPLPNKAVMLDEGSQTAMSGDEIDDMLRNKAGIGALGLGAGAVAGAAADHMAEGSPRRPGSSGSLRNKPSAPAPAPPLPPDHTAKIAAAAKAPVSATALGTMGPPLMPASAYRGKARPVTPSDKMPRTMSRDGTTPRAVRTSIRDQSTSGRLSHRSSVSSFASELDVRFNINREHLMYPDDVQPATDPRMIQAITQTMIGEYLWKYTRKAGRTDHSTTRHKRFFWVHPYTRTLYWSESDPSTANKSMMRAKSVPIESVRVITDDNVNPPGLHRKSLVVITPSREIVMTAPTSQRHETWINALSYLLLKSEAEKEGNDITEEDLEEFNPHSFSIRRSISRIARSRSRSRMSMSSRTSRANTRNSSPTGRRHRESAMSERPDTASRSQSHAPAADSMASRTGKPRDSSRFSSISSRFGRPHGRMSPAIQQPRAESSLSSRKGENGVYNSSAIADSAEDVRQAIERQEHDADMLENVRACCDGKHDVGSLSRNSRHMGLKPRMSGSHAAGHSHNHA